jgi:hypothetical protein
MDSLSVCRTGRADSLRCVFVTPNLRPPNAEYFRPSKLQVNQSLRYRRIGVYLCLARHVNAAARLFFRSGRFWGAALSWFFGWTAHGPAAGLHNFGL